ncbi:hypothetical protein SVAN01_03148 [Stagonosporopsis vannaccii]|nr:hypothetical protein SVAN01_03148 [Stagonosporopsis vannaccii]
MLNESLSLAGELEASNGGQPACSFAGAVKARNGPGTRHTKKSHAAWRAMLLRAAKTAVPAWTSRQPLKTLLDAGNAVAKDQSEEEQVMARITPWTARDGPIVARSGAEATARWQGSTTLLLDYAQNCNARDSSHISSTVAWHHDTSAPVASVTAPADEIAEGTCSPM